MCEPTRRGGASLRAHARPVFWFSWKKKTQKGIRAGETPTGSSESWSRNVEVDLYGAESSSSSSADAPISQDPEGRTEKTATASFGVFVLVFLFPPRLDFLKYPVPCEAGPFPDLKAREWNYVLLVFLSSPDVFSISVFSLFIFVPSKVFRRVYTCLR